ncbi:MULTISPECIES: NlpC/P60 family protein [unclassified Aureimonas]|uniref:C40 family peptidase n=1 Tax=unclassified Aureimonas TaxID=2615206 RepID=UPI000701E542|nr:MULTISPECIES: NlpC/P60 family protein [unclassified Aureimonas]KQT53866.1 peptidase P60 [Aureimonas sp. Leaf427]KQT71693.1 peptidase P60 [Aureimonas sp. Leaf460]
MTAPLDRAAPLDKRLNAMRPDLADVRLKGRVEADRFVEGRPEIVLDPIAPLRRAPRPDAALETEALYGETVLVFETDEEGWSWVQLLSDGYVGYMPTTALGPSLGPSFALPTHRVAVPRTLLFPGPDIKLPPLAGLPMGALVAVRGEAADHNATYGLVHPAGAIVRQHLSLPDAAAEDVVATAERFLGTPYLWGGKSTLGIDCSGLVQLALSMAGCAAPRDADLQEQALGAPLPTTEPLRRGDLVFWKGHVGLMADKTRLLHANAFHMMVTIEPLADVVARAEARGSRVTSVRRL